MLKLIEFSDEDTLYILGDVVDRGKYPIRTLLYIMDHPSIEMIIGNHEEMMRRSSESDYFNCWMNNGGEVTLNQYSNLCQGDRDRIDKYLKDLPTTIDLDGILLIHAGYTKEIHDLDFCLWAREEFLNRKTGIDKTVIFGHTPTYFITGNKPMNIWHGDGRIGIDCGACFKGGRLGCLRLDDMKEFYI